MASKEELLAQAKEIQRQKLLEQARAIQAQKLQPEDSSFFDSNRYALENIPSTAEQMRNPAPEQIQKMRDLSFGAMGASGGISNGLVGAAKTPLQSLGKKIYDSGFKKVNEVVKDFGKKPVSDVLFNYGVTGTNNSVMEQGKVLIDALVQKQRNILSQIDQKVPEADLERALQPLKNKIDEFKLSRDPVKMQAADALAEDLQTYQNIKRPQGNPQMEGPTQPISPSQMSAMKTTAQNLLPKSAYSQEIAKMSPVYQQGKKALGAGLRQEVQRAAEQASPQLGQNLLGVNEDLGSLLTAGKALKQEAMKGVNKNILTSVDPMVGALGHASGMAVPALAAKKSADLAKTTWLRSNLGQDLFELGEQNPQNAARIWFLLNEAEKNKENE